MLLTKDNLLRFVKQKKYVIPSDVSSEFETSTMIASAALSELAKDGSVKITHLKLSSSPYYYDKTQKEAIQDLADKHFSGHDLNLYKKLKESQILNSNSLSAAEQLATIKIRDFGIPLEIETNGKTLKFWVWYLRDLDETTKQIKEYLLGDTTSKETKVKEEVKKPSVKKEETIDIKKQLEVESKTAMPEVKKEIQREEIREKEEQPKVKSNPQFQGIEVEDGQEDKVQSFIEQYLKSNYLKVEEKDKLENGIFYSAILKINKITLHFDCKYFSKKPQETDIIKFYTSSMNPKIVFVENAPKKLFKLADNLENLELVNI
jgi:hypothetical protein